MKLAALALLAACGPKTPRPAAKVIETAEVTVPIPDGYKDLTASMRAVLPHIQVALDGPRNAVIVFQKMDVRGGKIDAAGCTERGARIVESGRRPDESPPRLDSAITFAWTGGTGCEYRYATPGGVTTLLVELHPAGAGDDPRAVWTMTCQYDAGDADAIATCRRLGADVRLRPLARAP